MTQDERKDFFDDVKILISESQAAHINSLKREMDSHNKSADHIFVREMINERKLKKDRIEAIKTQIWGWGIISLLMGVAASIASYIKLKLGN